MFKDMVIKNRSYRRFDESKRISSEQLRELIDIGRLVPSGGNGQPLRYILVHSEEKCAEVFPTLMWAAYLKDWDGPAPGERPVAYIIILSPAGQNTAYDEGIAGQTILLAAAERGMGGCFIGSVNRAKLAEIIPVTNGCGVTKGCGVTNGYGVPEGYGIKLVIALGYPKEEIVLEDVSAGDDIKYYRDHNQVHHVPKIKLDDMILTEL